VGHGDREELIQRHWTAGRAAHPGVGIEAPAFADYLAERVARADDPRRALAEVHAADLYLACGCAAGNAAALAAFDRLILPRLRTTLRQVDRSPGFIDEMLQVLRVSLFVADGRKEPAIATYTGSTPLLVWLRVVAVRAALRRKRQDRRLGPLEDDELADRAAPPEDAEVLYLRQRYAGAFRAAFRQAFESLDHRGRTLLRQHFLDHLSLDRLAQLHQVHRATVARWIAACRADLSRDVRRLLLEQLGGRPSEISSLVRVVRSEIRSDLGRLVRQSVEKTG
jgi:RNA polymerase sigma-70 factor, ECF subfamily